MSKTVCIKLHTILVYFYVSYQVGSSSNTMNETSRQRKHTPDDIKYIKLTHRE